jgi:hypothetical protein
MNERRMNLRTVSVSTRARLETQVDERHGRALTQSHEEVRELQKKLEEEQYAHLLAKEAVVLRAKNQKRKDKVSALSTPYPFWRMLGESSVDGVAEGELLIERARFSAWCPLCGSSSVIGVSSPRAGFLGHVGELIQQVFRECVISASLHRVFFIVNRDLEEKLRERLESVHEELNLHQRW